MRLSRFYTDRTNLTLNSSLRLPDSDIRHIRNALRLKKGSEIIIFNGEKEYLAELSIVGREFVTAKIKKILKVEDFSEDAGIEITLFQSLLRSGNFDLIIEKTTEIGIDSIVPMETEFSQVKTEVADRKAERWQKISIVASKQSERIKIPEIYKPTTFKETLALKDKYDLVLFFTIPRENISVSKEAKDLKEFIANLKSLPKHVAFYIGPEGGFSPTEHKLAMEAGFQFVKLGNTILRSETAAISMLSVLKYIFA